MNVSLVAERYANALFMLAIEKNAAEEVYADAKVISAICKQSRDLQLFLKSPVIHSDKKIKIIREIFASSIGPISLAYLLVMIRKRREKYIPEIACQVIEQYKEYKNILTVYFKAPVAPDEGIRRKVLELMNHYTSANIELVEEIEKNLIGGFVLTWKDKQYDGSIKRQIEKLERGLARVNLYVKGF